MVRASRQQFLFCAVSVEDADVVIPLFLAPIMSKLRSPIIIARAGSTPVV